MKGYQQGQSLIEIVVAIGVIVLILVALISAVTTGLRNAEFARNKGQATKYAQQVIEWLRTQRDAGWASFYDFAGPGGSSRTYCINTLAWPGTGPCSITNVMSGDSFNIFHREVTLSQSSPARVAIRVRVFWEEGQRTSEVTVDTYLTKWL
jgi:type II secretory pathway pseudopilin PulG